MIFKQVFRLPMRRIPIAVLAAALVFEAGCRSTRIYFTPEEPKQGDRVWIGVDDEERDEVDQVYVRFADREGWAETFPAYFTAETCKDTEPYMTELEVEAVTTYVDGETKTRSRRVDLTRSLAAAEDDDLDYALYVTQDSDESYRDQALEMANAFMDEFDAYSNSQFLWAEPHLYTTGCATYANSADLTISWGHGLHHTYYTGVGSVDLSTTGYGNFRPCGGNGDAEYIVFFSCLTLSRADSDGHEWWHFWRNYEATKSDVRPFSGLHMAMGFGTVVRTRCFFGCDGEDLFEEFAANLDSGDRVIDAWQEAVGDELSFNWGHNRGVVMFLPEYEFDTIYSVEDDYIYGNSRYSLRLDYWE